MSNQPDRAFISDVIEEGIRIQQIPAPTFDEQVRASYVMEQFKALGLADVRMDDLCNVYSRRPGGDGPSLLVSAHTDTVFPAETDLTIRREGDHIYGPGIGDNSIAVSSLLGLQRWLNAHHIELAGDLHIVANVREEGLGNLDGMREVVSQLNDTIDAVITLEGGGLDWIGYSSVGSTRYKVTASSPGGHSWNNFGTESAIHRLVQVANELTQLSLSESPKATLNIGTIEGGRSVNTIAQDASLLLDVRSECPDTLTILCERVESALAYTGHPDGEASIAWEVIGQRPAVLPQQSQPLVALYIDMLKDYGFDTPDTHAASTDAAIPLSQGIPGFCIGLGQVDGMHSTEERLSISAFERGFRKFVTLVTHAYDVMSPRKTRSS